ncbi:MAG TPA: response regulator [bacterium]|nr:response regulator [bacterium]HPN33768.1 response regulator [bacterium]
MSEAIKILLIDDDVDFILINRTILEANGYEVDACFDARCALEKIKTWKPDLICLDVMMPTGTEGFHLAYKIRRDPECQNIPILMITSIHDYSDFRFSTEDGDFLPVDEFIEKPIRAEVLLKKVRELLATRGAASAKPPQEDKGIGLKKK